MDAVERNEAVLVCDCSHAGEASSPRLALRLGVEQTMSMRCRPSKVLVYANHVVRAYRADVQADDTHQLPAIVTVADAENAWVRRGECRCRAAAMVHRERRIAQRVT